MSFLDEMGSQQEEPPPRRSRKAKRRGLSPVTVFGIVLLIVGLCCLSWVGYQYFGTNVVSQKKFDEEKSNLREKWESSEPSAEPAGDGKEKPKEAVIPGDAIALMRIPAFGDDYEIPILSGTDLDTLSRGIGHYKDTAAPGEVGNFAVAGHRVTHGQPFQRLLDLKKGDKVVVETRDAIFTYALDVPPKDLTVPDTDLWVLDPVPGKDTKPKQELLTLTTCQDLFHSPDRSIGFAHLVSTKNKR